MLRSVVRIAGLALAAIIAFIAWMVGPPLFLAIPWPIRWWSGMACFLGLNAALLRWTLRHSPPRPWPLVDPGRTPGRALHRALAGALQLITLSFAYPFFARPGMSAGCDWDLHLAWFAALRLCIVGYGQFPWWDPWCCGGFPLAFEPQVGLVSLDTLFVLPFGTLAGLKLAAIASMMLATEGARRLARHLFADPWAVALVAAVYGWNGSIIIFTVSGHALTICYPFLPWMLLYALRINGGPRPALLLGAASAFSVLAVIQYPTAYGSILAAAVLLWGGLARPAAGRARYLALVGVAAGTFLALAGWRLVLTGLVLRDFPRHSSIWIDNSLYNLAHALIDRHLLPPRVYPYLPGFDSEMADYIGVIPVAAAALSLLRGWRWWHSLAAVCFAMAIGSVSIYHPSYWVSTWPGFSTMHSVGRWRIPGLIGIALAAGSQVQAWRDGPGLMRAVAAALVVGVIADLALYAHQNLPSAFCIPPAEREAPAPPVPAIVNLQAWSSSQDTRNFEAVRRGYGVVQGYAPLLGYDRGRPTARLWRGHPRYIAESTSGGRPVEPESWSPNLIRFRLRPHQEVVLNQNPGSYWRANGVPAFGRWKCAELLRPFVARADARGQLRLEIRPPGVPLAIGTSAFGLVMAALCLRLSARLPGRGGGPGG